MDACKNSENEISDHFGEVTEMVSIGSGAKRGFPSYQLSRYACYLIVMNGDSSKKIVALGQTYFAVKTRQQELIENFDDLTEDLKRLAIRNEMKIHNKSLAEAAQMAGISKPRDYAIFQNKGYQGLYGGLGRKENIIGKEDANRTHYEVGKKVRETIKDLGGTMPEDLPTPIKSIKQIEKEQRKKIEEK